MRLFFSAAISVVFFACSDNPLAERVDELEQRLDEVEAAQEEDRLSLLARLDALAVTADNAEEIVAVRAKLNQTSITRSEFTRLANRVTALESQIADWSGVVSSMQHSIYVVLYEIWDAEAEDFLLFSFVGTAFAVESSTLVTNAHVIDALVELDDYVEQWNRTYGTDLWGTWLATQNIMADSEYIAAISVIETYRLHPQWDPDNLYSPDVGTLHIQGDYLWPYAALATRSEVYQLKVGGPIATLGFPGELQGDELVDFSPIATFKDGTISALRPPLQGEPYTAFDTYIVQHNLDLSGGTSGSPIFDASGRVVAVNNSGIEADFNIDGDWPRITQAALGFGIRADKIHEVLDAWGIAAKRTTHAGPSRLASRLNGRDIRSLDIVTTREGLAERLAEMQ